MATVNLGSIKFKWKGTYAGGTAYTIDDVVSYNGSSYICIQASTGNLPTDTAYFEQMSSAGTNGTDGTDLGTTLTTQGDIVYRDGSGLARLGAGTSGQFLKTLGTGANPVWGDVAGGILQIVDNRATSGTTQYTTTSTSYVDVGSEFQVTITPQFANSKILIYSTFVAQASGGRTYYTFNKSGDVSDNGDLHFQIASGADAITNSENIGSVGDGSITMSLIDKTVASTNALTYKLRFYHSNTNATHVGVAGSINYMTAIELANGVF
jgi:hypothetical protein